MIELIQSTVDHYNMVIELRNKVYRLALDLNILEIKANHLAVLASEILTYLLKEQRTVLVKLVFTKAAGCYFFHNLITVKEQQYKKLIAKEIFTNISHRKIKGRLFLDLNAKIPNREFRPTDEFLLKAKERLIQESKGEMVYEIRKKNAELSKALQDLKNSSLMIQSEKMRALGSMTAGAAHELNNPLMGILNFIQYAIKHTDKDYRTYKPLVDAEQEVKRCIDIVSNLLTFSRMKAEGEEPLSHIKISVLFDRILQILSHKIKEEQINILKHYPTIEETVAIRENSIQQVLMNLISNAIDSMKESKEKKLILSFQLKQNELELTVSDTGSGMDEETQDKIFEPFFTTKTLGQGTGLGLAVSLGIIEEQEGSLTFTSQKGIGSTFKIILPLKE